MCLLEQIKIAQILSLLKADKFLILYENTLFTLYVHYYWSNNRKHIIYVKLCIEETSSYTYMKRSYFIHCMYKKEDVVSYLHCMFTNVGQLKS